MVDPLRTAYIFAYLDETARKQATGNLKLLRGGSHVSLSSSLCYGIRENTNVGSFTVLEILGSSRNRNLQDEFVCVYNVNSVTRTSPVLTCSTLCKSRTAAMK